MVARPRPMPTSMVMFTSSPLRCALTAAASWRRNTAPSRATPTPPEEPEEEPEPKQVEVAFAPAKTPEPQKAEPAKDVAPEPDALEELIRVASWHCW